jgi:hypothetical protein
MTQLVREDRGVHLPTRVEFRPQDLSTLREEYTTGRDRELTDHADIPSALEPLMLGAHLEQDQPESAPSGAPGLPRRWERLLTRCGLTKHGLHFPTDPGLLPDTVGFVENLSDLALGERRVEFGHRAGGQHVHAHRKHEDFQF